ncbi:MAG: ubiquitin-like protein Pup [Acidimicrobiia bacterium]|nr:ubiquitin-like protein Pup [Acidimicrobiia bacterium]
MSDRERSRPQGRDNEQEEAVEEVEAAESSATEGIDDLLDEIDSVLEENAEEFVRNYVQKGGE